MGRRIGLGLLAALALLVAPTAATAATQRPGRDDHPAARIVVADRHATVAHVVARPHGGRERRAPQHLTSSPGVLGAATGVAPELAWARLDALVAGPTDDLRSSSQPRAPPALV